MQTQTDLKGQVVKMKTQKRIVVVTIPICVFCLLLSTVLEFTITNCPHISYFSNLLVGIFASGLLVTATALVTYFVEKEKYYKLLFSTMSDMLLNTEYLIIELRNKRKNFHSSEVIKNIQSAMNCIRIEMWNYSSFGRSNYKDKIVDTVVGCVIKISLILDVLQNANVELSSGNITITDYTQKYNAVVDELAKTNLSQIKVCKTEVDKVIRSLTPNRDLACLFDEKEATKSI